MMKLIYALSVLLACFCTEATGRTDKTDGIKFFEGTWKEALKKSATENKPIFLDISTSWCGNCKKLKQNTFTDKKAGEYFNKNFINVELDAEQGEGKRLAQKFGVTGYPTLFLVDKNEQQLLTSEGYHDADDLINLITSAVKKKP
jgi:thioredoxin 1